MKLCECGCGEATALAKKTSIRDGTVKGQSNRFIAGHHQKLGTRKPRPPLERFWAKVDKRAADECWEWTARRTRDGYGQFRLGATGSPNLHAHRALWLLMNGPISDGLLVCHTCDNRACCNLKHLFLGTPADNSADMRAKGRQCRGEAHRNFGKAWSKVKPEQRARGERNGASKLTAEKVREIRHLAAAGARQIDLAEQFGIEQSNISKIIRRQAWVHVA